MWIAVSNIFFSSLKRILFILKTNPTTLISITYNTFRVQSFYNFYFINETNTLTYITLHATIHMYIQQICPQFWHSIHIFSFHFSLYTLQQHTKQQKVEKRGDDMNILSLSAMRRNCICHIIIVENCIIHNLFYVCGTVVHVKAFFLVCTKRVSPMRGKLCVYIGAVCMKQGKHRVRNA